MAIVRLRPAAREDLLGIWLYIAHENEQAAHRLVQKFNNTFQSLATLPFSGQARPELGSDIRSRPVDNYVVFYHAISDGIEVLRVLHSRQDVDSIFQL